MTIESLGGYRLVRKLGEGARAEVFLAHPERDDATDAPAAIKLPRAGVDDASILAEASALSRAAGDHVVALLDVTEAPGGAPALILERLAGGTLGRLLRDRAGLGLGEAITILAPIAQAVARLHDAGVVHGGVRTDAVLFNRSGAPTLACFGRASLVDPGLSAVARENLPSIAADIRAVAVLTRSVLGTVHNDAAAALAEWVESSCVGVNSYGVNNDAVNNVATHDDWLVELATRLFALGDAEPIDFRVDSDEPDAPRVPSRLVSGDPVVEPVRERSGTIAALALPEWIEGLIPQGMAGVVGRLRTALSAVRVRVWVIAGAVGAALVAAMVLIPTGDDSDAATVHSPSPEASAATAVDQGPVSGDDPVAAFLALLEARDRCIRDLSVLCLDDVGQAGSAALADDQHLIRQLKDGEESTAPVQASEPVLEERLGDSAIVSLGPDSEPASVLLMKGEAGWRIRDYLP